MSVQKLCECVDVSLFQFITHHDGQVFHFFQCFSGFFAASDVVAYYVAEEVSCQAALSCVDQGEAFLEFCFCGFIQFRVFHTKFLFHTRTGSDIFYAAGQASDLILPAAACAHDLLQVQDQLIYIGIRPVCSEKFSDGADSCSGKDAAGSQSGTFRHAFYPG